MMMLCWGGLTEQTVFNWDRGADVPAADHTVACIVDFLAGGLADHIYS